MQDTELATLRKFTVLKNQTFQLFDPPRKFVLQNTRRLSWKRDNFVPTLSKQNLKIWVPASRLGGGHCDTYLNKFDIGKFQWWTSIKTEDIVCFEHLS